ncbi:MAG: hypothetical protein KatS3mg005_1346 [Bryobacteraceae bacterium]|nr:MAG: hypothetical protein KatS3mg005_1346 [Bryobacteraceae bacterium]
MVEKRGKKCAGAEEWRLRPGGNQRGWENPVPASAALFAWLPYLPFRFDTPEPLTLALFGAAFLMIAWRI